MEVFVIAWIGYSTAFRDAYMPPLPQSPLIQLHARLRVWGKQGSASGHFRHQRRFGRGKGPEKNNKWDGYREVCILQSNSAFDYVDSYRGCLRYFCRGDNCDKGKSEVSLIDKGWHTKWVRQNPNMLHSRAWKNDSTTLPTSASGANSSTLIMRKKALLKEETS